MKIKKGSLIFDRGKTGRGRLGLVTEKKDEGFVVKDFNGETYYTQYISGFDQARLIFLIQTNKKVKTVEQAIKAYHHKIFEALLDKVRTEW